MKKFEDPLQNGFGTLSQNTGLKSLESYEYNYWKFEVRIREIKSVPVIKCMHMDIIKLNINVLYKFVKIAPLLVPFSDIEKHSDLMTPSHCIYNHQENNNSLIGWISFPLIFLVILLGIWGLGFYVCFKNARSHLLLLYRSPIAPYFLANKAVFLRDQT